MAGNRSLDEFVEADEPSDRGDESPAVEPAPDTGPAPDSVDGPEPGGAETAIEPMAETFVWSSAGGECAACGAVTEERWRDGQALVCADCKDW